ncbi:hypothetical protein BST97_00925 [Nonlabens spongiae]|uniref:Glycerophosphoryl diester phosphodiesterase membrane domain-containing protein n=1 Tax=Nonlabens spongiae TaxID=331648 RepID=A0A1W6MGH6_9FLAO|nr:hypothetical protein [Nonlabens spongiae]ARN76680.1 hypothetical protein BST97_00925 [Nonlabens spongiae]
MDKNYVEPRLRRDFGGIITAYFEFVRYNYKGLFNSFIAYNGIFMILVLLFGYLFITNIVEYAVTQSNWVPGEDRSEMGALAAGMSVILFFLVLGLASIFNYCIASAYISIYERDKENNVTRKAVWKKFKPKIWGMIVYIIAAVTLYFVYFIVNIILAFIPILGTLVSLLIALGFNVWMGLTVFSYIHGDGNVFESFGEAWTLLFRSFWKSIGVNFVIGFIIQITLFALNMVPGVIMFLYVFNSVETNNGLEGDVFSQILIVVMMALFAITFMLIQLFSQSVNGFLYFNLHEVRHNTYLRSRIDKLGEIT